MQYSPIDDRTTYFGNSLTKNTRASLFGQLQVNVGTGQIKQAVATLDEASLHCKAALDICEKFGELILFLESNGNLKTIKEIPNDEYFICRQAWLTMMCSSLTPPLLVLRMVPQE